jgi:Pyrimidine dimer DNA glycosylase
MVNTFIVNRDFKVSASKLDRARLGKQRVEAQQILDVILSLKYCSKHLDIQLLTLETDILKIYREVRKTRIVNGKTVKLGFCHHPCVKMWFHYENALKYYIDCHILEFAGRGYNNNMKLHETTDFEYPKWITDDLIRNHRAALINKELIRNEPKWYSKMKWEYYLPFTGYNWNYL